MTFSGEFNFADCRFYEFRGNKFSPNWISNFPRALGTSFRRFGKSDVRNLYTAARDVILSCLFIFTVLISESSKRMTQSYRKARFRLPFGLGAEHVVVRSQLMNVLWHGNKFSQIAKFAKIRSPENFIQNSIPPLVRCWDMTVTTVTFSESSNIAFNLAHRILRRLGQRAVARRGSGVVKKKYLIGYLLQQNQEPVTAGFLR